MQSNGITISVIAPIYGVERYIRKFAESLLGQSYPWVEFIFVNDGAKDSSMEILHGLINEKYAHLLPRITIVNKENAGLPAARRTGLDYATGDYIYHVDSDDWLEEGALERMAAKIEQTGCDILCFGFVKEYTNRRSVKYPIEYSAATRQQFVSDMYNHRTVSSVWNKCIKRSLYTENTIYTPAYSYAEDCYITSQLVGYATSFATLNEVLYHYRKDNPNALTRSTRRKRKQQYALNFLDLYEKYRDVEESKNPVATIFDDILIQAGWYSIFYRLDLFTQYPFLASAIRGARMACCTDVPLVAQIITKLVALFK